MSHIARLSGLVLSLLCAAHISACATWSAAQVESSLQSAEQSPFDVRIREEACATSWSQQGNNFSEMWWHALQDEHLNALVIEGLNKNLQIQLMSARLMQARALQKAAGAARMPRLDARIGGSRERVPLTRQRGPDGESLTIKPHQQSQFDARGEVSYEIDLMGRLRQQQQVAEHELVASQCDKAATHKWLIREVVDAYVSLRVIDEGLQQLNEDLELMQELVQAEERKARAGLIAKSEVLTVQWEITALRDAKLQQSLERQLAQARLSVLLGHQPQQWHLEPRQGYFLDRPVPSALSASLPAAVIGGRPDVAAAWERVAAADVDRQQVALERYPNLTLTGSTGYLSEAFRHWFYGDALAWLASAVVQAPVWDGGRIQAKQSQAIAVFNAQQTSYRQTVLGALADVAQAINRAQTASQRMDLAVADLKQHQHHARSVQHAMRSGRVSRLQYLRVTRQVLESRKLYEQRRFEVLSAWMDVHQAIGS